MKKCPDFLYAIVREEEKKLIDSSPTLPGLGERILFEFGDKRLQSLPEGSTSVKVNTFATSGAEFTYDIENDVWKTTSELVWPQSENQ